MYKNEIYRVISHLNSAEGLELGIATRLMKLAELVQIADSNNDKSLGAWCRLLLIREEQLSPKLVYGFPAFAWLLQVREEDPTVVEDAMFFHIYKWIVASAIGISSFSLNELKDLFLQFKEALLSRGYSLRSYYQVKTLFYLHLHDAAAVRQHLKTLRSLEVDEVSDNYLFETSVEVYCCLLEGNVDEAILVGRPLIEEEETAFETLSVIAFETLKIDEVQGIAYYTLANEHRKNVYYQEQVIDLRGRLIAMYFSFITGDESCWLAFKAFKNAEEGAADFYSLQVSQFLASLLVFDERGSFEQSSGMFVSKEQQKEELIYYRDRTLDLAKKFDLRNLSSDYEERVRSFFKRTKVLP